MKLRYQYVLGAFILAFGIFLGIALEYKRQIPLLTYTRELSHSVANEDEVRFIILGDTGSGNKDQKMVAELIETLCLKEKPDAVLLVGDNFYEHGVASIDDPQWSSKFLNMYGGECSKNLKFYAVLGNHDYEGNTTAQIQFTEKSAGRWNMPSRYFRVHFGKFVDLFAIDTNFPDRCGLPLCSLSWTKSAMQE